MDDKESQDQAGFIPIWSISEGWRALFVAILILTNLGGTVVSITIEIEQRELFEDAFEDIISRTALMGVGSVPVAFALTELARTFKMLSTWVEKKLNENLRKSREKRIAKERKEQEKALMEARKEAREAGRRQGREEGREEGREQGLEEGYIAGREAERAVIAGEEPPPPPWERNGSDNQDPNNAS